MAKSTGQPVAYTCANDAPASTSHDHGWISQRAVAWVIDDAPVPADLAWTLTVIARSCDKNGRGARQSTPTIAEKAGKSVKQAQREIKRLRELGLLVLGDQRLVDHLPPRRRPTVYDLPLTMRGPKPIKESRNPTGLKKDGSRPPLDAVSRPPLEGREKNLPEEPFEKPSSPLPPSAPASAVVKPDRTEEEEIDLLQKPKPQDPHPDAVHLVNTLPTVNGKHLRPNERHQLAAAVTAKLQAGWTTTALRKALTDDLNTANGPRVYGWRLANQIGDTPPPTPGCHDNENFSANDPPWCGQCNQTTRSRTADDGEVYRCRRCHPVMQPVGNRDRQPRTSQRSTPRVQVDPPERSRGITGVVASDVTGQRWQPPNLTGIGTNQVTAPPAPPVPPGQRTAEAMLAESMARAAAASAKVRAAERRPGAAMAELDALLAGREAAT